jgi:general secretion pathway protein J
VTTERTLIPSQRNPARLGSRGFTLLELLVAIMILTLIMTASFGSVRIASRSWEAGQSRADANEEMRAVSDFLRRRFGQMSSFVWVDGNEERIAFIGEQRHIRFIAPAPEYSVGPGLFVYTIKVETEDGAERLVLSYSPFDPGTGNFSEPYSSRQTILTGNLTNASFEYYGAEMADIVPSWQQTWQRDAELFPAMIRIRTTTAGSPNGWPDLVFTLRANDAI